MTDPIQAAIERAEETCPCRIRHGANHDTVAMCAEIACWCYSLKIDRETMAFGWPGDQDKRPACKWPGHAAIRSLAVLAFSTGMDLGIGACEAATGIRLEYPPVPEEIRALLPESREVKP